MNRAIALWIAVLPAVWGQAICLPATEGEKTAGQRIAPISITGTCIGKRGAWVLVKKLKRAHVRQVPLHVVSVNACEHAAD